MTVWDTGARLGPFELVARIGAGGAGDVWKARDVRLDRAVAIKRLRDPDADFVREARTIAALNHPHICTLHDVGDDYMVMELVDGVPLAGPLPPAEAVRLALQIAGALEAAHRHGIVHRDLKPANIVVSGGRVKLLDFGIARVYRPAGEDPTTTIDTTIVGTPAYMSPEQAQGMPIDARSDIFSFGAVLYEMLSGRRAFAASSATATMASVLRDDPPALAVADRLWRIVQRCLEKSPGSRYQSMGDVRAALEQLSLPSMPSASVAVLPFANMSPDPEQEYFSDGLTEEIINALAHVPGLKVIARTSAFAFKGQNVPIGRIAEALGVSSILEGSVRRAGNRIRVTAQLINAADGCHQWSERYDRELADVFAVQDEIASAIAGELRGRLGDSSVVARSHTPDLGAYEAFLMARHHVWRHTPDGYEQGHRWYQKAIALDPRYPLPYTGLAEMFHIRASLRGPAAQEAAAQIGPAIERALALDPAFPDAHAWRGILAATYQYDWVAAERHFRAAAAVEPVAPRIRHIRGYFWLRFIGASDEAVIEHQRALQADPLNLVIRVGHVLSLMSAERATDAATEADRLFELAPDFVASYTLLARDVATAPLSVALPFAERLNALSPSAGSTGVLAGLLRRAGEQSRAAALLEQVADPAVYGNPIDLALYHLAGGETDRAFDAMNVAVQQRHPFLMMVVVGGPYGRILRASARWPAFAASIGLPP